MLEGRSRLKKLAF